jgi:hypothetical protein
MGFSIMVLMHVYNLSLSLSAHPLIMLYNMTNSSRIKIPKLSKRIITLVIIYYRYDEYPKKKKKMS